MRFYNGKYINEYIQCHATLLLACCFECIPCQWYISGTRAKKVTICCPHQLYVISPRYHQDITVVIFKVIKINI